MYFQPLAGTLITLCSCSSILEAVAFDIYQKSHISCLFFLPVGPPPALRYKTYKGLIH